MDSSPTGHTPALDPHRPQYHFLPAGNWLNDPNGLIQWNGRYHLFYQHNPGGPFHGTIHWGHAVSDDLVHWEHLPIALTPAPDSFDFEGCWSGCAVDVDGVPTLVYTAINPQTVAIATSSDELVTWEKHEGNPVIAAPPTGIDAGDPAHFRDPYVWRENGTWYMVMGIRIVGRGGAVLLYRSADLTEWEYLKPVLVGDETKAEPFWTANMWECPNLFELGDRHVLIISFADVIAGKLLYSGYFTGHYEDYDFDPEKQEILEYGGHFYAPQVMQDDQGRWLIWGWLWEGRSLEAQKDAGWAGVMSLPRVLSPGPDGSVAMEPAPELESLRGEQWRSEDVLVSGDDAKILAEIQGDTLEIKVTFSSSEADRYGLALARSPGGEEETRIVYDRVAQALTVDRRRSSLSPAAHDRLPESHRAVSHAPLPLDADEPLQLHIFLDRSVLEIFATAQSGKTVSYSTRIYPTRPDSTGLQLFAENGIVLVDTVEVWQMGNIWQEAAS